MTEGLPVHEALEQAEAVFAGRAVGWEELDWHRFLFLVEFKVTKVWKGVPYETRWVGDSSNDCGNFFEEGVEYLIYGAKVAHPDRNLQYRDSQILLMTLDFGTPLESAQEDLEYLGAGQAPVPGWGGPKPGEEAPPEPAETGTGTLTRSQQTDGWAIAMAAGAAVLLAGWGRIARVDGANAAPPGAP